MPRNLFRRVLLAFNPAAGRSNRKTAAQITQVGALFRRSGAEVCEITLGPDAAAEFNGTMNGCDLVLVCGGDGTVNQVLQSLIACGSRAALGIIPIGSGNLFAVSLGICRHPLRAAESLLEGDSIRISLGTIETNGCGDRRYWVAAAGIGADARVICGVNPQWKARFGQGAYYAESIRQLCSPQLELPWFRVDFTDSAGAHRTELVTQLIAERIEYFGAAVSRPPVRLGEGELRLVMVKSKSRWPYLRFGAALLASQFRMSAPAGEDVESVAAHDVVCTPLVSDNGHRAPKVLAEVDGELVGAAPARLNMVPDALTVVVPSG